MNEEVEALGSPEELQALLDEDPPDTLWSRIKVQRDIRPTPHAIYLLGDPRNGDIRYLGKSKNPCERLRCHSNEHSTTPVNRWVQSLKRRKIKVVMVVLEWTGDVHREFELLAQYKAAGFRMLNVELRPHNKRDQLPV